MCSDAKYAGLNVLKPHLSPGMAGEKQKVVIAEVPIPPLAESMQILSFGKRFDDPLDGFMRKIFSEGEDRTRVYAGEEVVAVEEGNTADRNYGAVVDIE